MKGSNRISANYMECGVSAPLTNLPMALVLDFEAVKNPKRIFPFDSGGHAHGFSPEFISSMPLNEFEVSDINEAPQKLMGAFFGSARNYFDFKGRNTQNFLKDFDLSPLDSEIHALHKLSQSKTSGGFDDRNFTIEIQTEKNIPLNPTNVLAVVLPITYLDEPKVVKHIEKNWGAEILSYDLFPLNTNYYYYAIYDKVNEFLKSRGMFR